ncbi:MAG TPA: serine/threonine-protein kinase, partial [Gemmatimonadales bacterium]|nr:serine/threonine-protein kinase [Gemmatimonadales bacterium]
MSADPLLERVSRALVDRYAVVRELGSGGMGTVYLATDRALGREVAIKVLPPSTREYLGADRFQRELRIAARLSHPHIVPLYEAGEADGLLYYVMAYVPGETLADRLRREGALPLAEALRLTSEVGDALQYAHEQGVIHRDVKPSNILLSRDHAFLMDFGVAKAMSGDSGTGPALTGTGVVVGTAEYMSPEQAAGEKRIDARTDVYAIAAVLYEMLTGEPPFTGPSLQAIVARVISDPPRPIHTIRPDLPLHVERALAAALAKTPADRPATVRQFGDLLAQPAERPIRRMPGWAWLGGGAAIALVGGVVWWALGGRDRAAAPAPAEMGPPSGMVLVPGGEYLVGGATGRAQRRVRLDSFYLDSTE